MGKIEKVIRYISSCFMYLLAIGMFGNKAIFGGIILILAGTMLLPAIDNLIKNEPSLLNFLSNILGSLQTSAIILFVIAVIITPQPNKQLENLNSINDENNIITNYINNIDGTNKLENKIENKIENNNIENTNVINNNINDNATSTNANPGISSSNAQTDNGESSKTSSTSNSSTGTSSKQTSVPVSTTQSSYKNTDESTSQTYILNTSTKKFHRPSCGQASRISEENKQTYNGSRQSLIDKGYEPCKKCNP